MCPGTHRLPRTSVPFRCFGGVHQGHKSDNRQPLYFMRTPNHCCLRNGRVIHASRFDLHGPDPMTGDIQDIVDAPQNHKVTVGIPLRPIAGEVGRRVPFRKLGLYVSFVIAADGA